MRRALPLLLLLLVGCDGESPPLDASPSDARVDAAEAGDAGGAEPCVAFDAAVEAGTVANPALDELSGLAASRTNPGVLYAINDSGDSARVFALRDDGADLGTIALSGAIHDDYEDIAIGPGPDGASWIYVGDVGDNNARDGSGAPRASIVVYRFAEPTIDAAGGPVSLDATPEAITLTYPATPHDCESVAVDPASGDLYLLTKENLGASTLFVARAPLSPDVVLEEVTTLEIGGFAAPGSNLATAMDLAPDGRGLLVRSYNRLYLWTREPTQSWADALAVAGLAVPVRTEPQGEAVAWRPDGRAYFTSSEGGGQPLFVYSATDPLCASL